MGIEKSRVIVPVFLPFEGCPHRCVFCAQDKQTGLTLSQPESIAVKLERLFNMLKRKKEESLGKLSVEIAFYGGTFTLLPPKALRLCLDMTRRLHGEGLIERARCSTRPDALNAEVLTKLKSAGVQLIELGVQSFSDRALSLVKRGYDSKQILEGCEKISSLGLDFGVQLLPGMPGSSPEVFLDDVEQSLALSPACMRFYPCIVVEGTKLADLWKKGLYQPWTLEVAVKTLGRALARAWSLNVPVIRLSLAPEESLDKAALIGPRHPALGSMAQGEALLNLVEKIVWKRLAKPQALYLPSFCKGFFYGHAKSLKERWAAIGVSKDNVYWSDKAYGEVVIA